MPPQRGHQRRLPRSGDLGLQPTLGRAVPKLHTVQFPLPLAARWRKLGESIGSAARLWDAHKRVVDLQWVTKYSIADLVELTGTQALARRPTFEYTFRGRKGGAHG